LVYEILVVDLNHPYKGGEEVTRVNLDVGLFFHSREVFDGFSFLRGDHGSHRAYVSADGAWLDSLELDHLVLIQLDLEVQFPVIYRVSVLKNRDRRHPNLIIFMKLSQLNQKPLSFFP
jgi:hypothetical protein